MTATSAMASPSAAMTTASNMHRSTTHCSSRTISMHIVPPIIATTATPPTTFAIIASAITIITSAVANHTNASRQGRQKRNPNSYFDQVYCPI